MGVKYDAPGSRCFPQFFVPRSIPRELFVLRPPVKISLKSVKNGLGSLMRERLDNLISPPVHALLIQTFARLKTHSQWMTSAVSVMTARKTFEQQS